MKRAEQSRKGRLRLTRGITVCLILIILAGFFMHRRHGAEKLCPWTFNGEIVIDKGRVYYTEYTWRGGAQVDAVYAQSVFGGKPATVFTSPPKTGIGSLAIRGASVFCSAWPSIPPAEALRAGVAARPAAQPVKENAAPAKMPPMPQAPPPVRIMSVPIQGGIPRRLSVVRIPLVYTERSAFWIDAPDENAPTWPRTRKSGVADRVNRRLMALSLTDGATRVAAIDLPDKCFPYGSKDAVFWSTPAMGAPHRIDLHVLPEHETTASVIHDLPEEAGANNFAFSGSLVYWLERSDQPKPAPQATARRIITAEKGPDGAYSEAISVQVDPNTAPTPMRLVSASLDGNTRRVSATARFEFVSAYRGHIYVIVTTGEGTGERKTLMRLHPDRANPLEEIRSLPVDSSQFQFDENYLYYLAAEDRIRLVDRLLGDRDRAERVILLCRIPLPK